MNTKFRHAIAGALFVAGTSVLAAEPPAAPAPSPEQRAVMATYERMAEVRAEHRQLQYFVGQWLTRTSMQMDPAQPPETSAGTVGFKEIFGGRSYEMNFQGSYAGQPMTGRGFIGFDNLKGKFYSTWMDSGSTGIWVSYGDYDAASKSYTFRGDMANPVKPSEAIAIRAVWRVVDADHFVFEWYETEPGSTERKSMWIDYSRERK